MGVPDPNVGTFIAVLLIIGAALGIGGYFAVSWLISHVHIVTLQ
jgi:hypothetical protein